MKIGVFGVNLNFFGNILEELQSHHTVRVYQQLFGNEDFLNKTNIESLLHWCDLAYFEFIQQPLPLISGQPWLKKPIVARMDGIDIMNHTFVDWSKVSALIIQPTQEKRLMRLRREWEKQNKRPSLKLPARILHRYIGIDLDRFKLNTKRKPGFNIVLHANLIRQTKGIYNALQCFSELIEKDGDNPWCFTLIARGEHFYRWAQRQEYVLCVQELLEELNFSSKRFKHYEGDLSKDNWVEYLQSQDIYWCLSRRESFGVSMAEACASGAYPLLNHFYAAELLYPQANLCRSPGELVDKTIQWGKLPDTEKLHSRQIIRKHVEQYDQRETAKKIRLLCEEVADQWIGI